MKKDNKTICWDCKRASGYDGGCNWSNYCIGACDTPEVIGWKAIKKKQEKITIPLSKLDGGLTYMVLNCPEFISDERSKTVIEECPFTIKMYLKLENDKTFYIVDIFESHSEEPVDSKCFETEREALCFYDTF